MKLEWGGESFAELSSVSRKWLSLLHYHMAWDCRTGHGASPQHRMLPHSWVVGWSSFCFSGIGPLHSCDHTRTRDSSGTSPQALLGE